MTLDQVSTWVTTNFNLGDTRRSKALAEMVWGLVHSAVVGFAAIGRCMLGSPVPASQITRVYRFCHNKYVDARAVQGALIAQLVGRIRLSICGVRLVAVAMDWHTYDNGRMSGLRVSLVTGSRALPMLWYEVETAELTGRRTSFETRAIRDLIAYRPPAVTWLILLDAGFRAPELIKLLDEAGFYVVRSQSASLFHSATSCWMPVGDLPIAVGEVVEFGWGYLTRMELLSVRLVGARIYDAKPPKPGLRRPRRRHNHTKPGLCIVATNLRAADFPAAIVIRLYARRFEIEHGFRDLKNATYGLDMEHVHLEHASTYERLMCVVAIAEALLWLAGTEAEMLELDRDLTPSRPRDWRRVLSLRTIGRLCLRVVNRTIRSMLRDHIEDAVGGYINVVGTTWKECPTNRRLRGAVLDRERQSALPHLCQSGQKHRTPECTPGPIIPRTASRKYTLYRATRAA